MDNLPEIFETFDDARQKGFLEVKKLKESGKKVVGVYCAFTPNELIRAAGAVPVGLCGTDEGPIPASEKHLPRNLCPLIKSSYGHALTDTCPYFYFSDLLVGETTCDGKKKMYEYIGKIKPMHVMQLPQSNKGTHSFNLWKEEMIMLKNRLEKEFGVEITEEKLRAEIKNRNEERRVLREFHELGKLSPPPVTGTDLFQVIYGTEFRFDKHEQKQYLKNIIEEVKRNGGNSQRLVSENAPRILVTGCPIGGAARKVIKVIEENGGVVVCYENCSGIKPNVELVDETIDPIDALTKKYLNIPCSVMSPNNERIELLSDLIDEYKVDGVIEVILQACHTYSVEGHRVKEFINQEKNIPYLNIETDYFQSDIGQLKTRISAFIEMF